jgi:hypothetical protein
MIETHTSGASAVIVWVIIRSYFQTFLDLYEHLQRRPNQDRTRVATRNTTSVCSALAIGGVVAVAFARQDNESASNHR